MAACAHDDWAFRTRAVAVRDDCSFSTSLFTTSRFLFYSPSSPAISFTFLSPLYHIPPHYFYFCGFFFFFSSLDFFFYICLSVPQSHRCKIAMSLGLHNVRDSFIKDQSRLRKKKSSFSFKVFSDMYHLVSLSGTLPCFSPWCTLFKQVRTEQSHSSADQNNQWRGSEWGSTLNQLDCRSEWKNAMCFGLKPVFFFFKQRQRTEL